MQLLRLGASDFIAYERTLDKLDLSGFFHSHDYEGATALYADLWQNHHGARWLSNRVWQCFKFARIQSFRRSVLQVPKSASGIWWSKWVNINQQDVLDIVETYESNRSESLRKTFCVFKSHVLKVPPTRQRQFQLDVFVFDMNVVSVSS